MDAARIHAKIYAGRAKAALRLGLACNVFRPLDATQALSHQIATTNVAFNAADQKYLRPNLYGKPVWCADYDGTLTQPGDYLVRQSDGNTWFVAAQQQLLPIAVVECNRTLSVQRVTGACAAVGVQPYSALTDLSLVLGSVAGWPASILIGGRVQAANGLPTDVKEAGWKILLPPSVPIKIQSGDILVDDLANRYAVESAEQSDLGWRLIANSVHD